MGRTPHEEGPLSGQAERISRERAVRAAQARHRAREALEATEGPLNGVRLSDDEIAAIRHTIGVAKHAQTWRLPLGGKRGAW